MSSNLDLSIQIILLQYAKLREEIYGRSRDQLLCIINSLLASGGLCTAIALSKGKFNFLVLIIPWILTVFGILWCDHHKAIHYIGSYLKRIENKEFTNLILSNNYFSNYVGWEQWFDDLTRSQKEIPKKFKNIPKKSITFMYQILPVFYFLVPSILSLCFYLYSICNKSFSLCYLYSFNLNPFGTILVLIDGFLILIFFVFYVDAWKSTNFKLTNRELKVLKRLISISDNNNFIIRRFKDYTGVEIDNEYLDQKRKNIMRKK